MSHEDNDFDEFEDNRTWRSRRRRDRNIEEEEEEEEDHERERIPIELRRKRGNDEEEGERKGKWSPKMKQMMAEKKKASERPKMVPRQKEVEISEGTSIASLSNLLGISYDTLRRKMRKLGFENTDPDFVLNSEMASLIVMEYDFKPIITSSFEEIELKARDPPESWDNYPLRPPVVTIMGHVDHGKTTLLDSLRKTSVAASEAGGITQHIGAFSVKLAGGHQITFMDTPGHAAFSAMRQRGANTTDIVVLVVAADDGVMPQTVEAIKHAKAANVPIIVAINKCDKPQANVRKTMEGLLAHDILLEEYGGEIPSVPVSGLTGKGLDKLEETILALSEFLDIRGDPTGAAEGVVIESELDRRLGNAATVLVRRGTLKTGSVVVSGTAYARVRVLADDRGEHIDEAGPSVPVRMYGWKTLPQAGDEVIEVITEVCSICGAEYPTKSEIDLIMQDESDPLPLARKIAESREEKAKSAARGVSIDELNDQRTRRKSGEEEVAGPDSERELRLIVKADVHGSLEALLDSIAGLPRHEVQANIVASGVGPPTESDIDMASATKSRIIAFNVATPKKMISHAAAQAVPLHEHNIIYRMIDHLKELLGDLLPPEKVAEVRGEAEIKQLFDVKGKGKVVNKAAGCFVRTGKIFMNKSVRVIREGGTVFEGQLKSLRFVKKEIPEAVKGQDCGILFVGFDDMREGDLVQSVEVVEYKRKFE
ncbi:hypothetical protein BJ742DRAFT_670758 [Cladochytrium replicatum]|nr:hypothetical protein BJ742DRAFT_670758 [Cladochytrium replicatum]